MADVIISMRTLILQSSEVSAIVGSQVYTDQLPQGKIPPSIVIYIDAERAYDHIGGPQGFDNAEIRVECYGQTRPAADELSRLVRDQVAGYFGEVDGVFIQSVAQRAGQKQQTVRRGAGGDTYQWVSRRDYLVGHSIPIGA